MQFREQHASAKRIDCLAMENLESTAADLAFPVLRLKCSKRFEPQLRPEEWEAAGKV